MDIFFLSFDETYREKNWQHLKFKFPQSRRVHGIKGIALAHQMCANLSQSPFFFVVNADNEILFENFQFQLPEQKIEQAIYTWRSLNPVNGLAYGFGAIKLFPKMLFLSAAKSLDVSTSLKIPYKIVSQMASITRFNSSPLEAWRGAFRECVKLSSQNISHQKTSETKERLKIWCEKAENQDFASYVLFGANQGREYGRKYKDHKMALNKINNFDWLKKFFIKNVKDKC